MHSFQYQIKSAWPVDEYVCTLSDELKKIAEKELRETDKIRAHAIKAIRDWALENPRIIKTRLDSTFLLKILRFRKYSIPLTQEAIERYMLYRLGLYGYDWFSNLDPLRPGIFTLLENGLIVPLPNRDKNGRKVILIKFAALDTSMPDVGNCTLSLLSIIMEIMLENEENQIRGLNYIIDLSGANLKQILIFPIDTWYKFGKNSEKACACRHKGFNIINLPPSTNFILNFALKHMPAKLRDRVKFFNDSSLADCGIIDKKSLPIEYGGDVPLKQITGKLFFKHINLNLIFSWKNFR